MLTLRDIKRLGIMGGTFDPIHYGHLLSAQAVMQRLRLDGVLFVPAGLSPFKRGKELADGHHRLRMVELAIGDNPRFFASPIEIKRAGVTYTIDTIKELAAEYPNAELYFIIGADQAANLDKWKDMDGLRKICNFVCTNRPGFEAGASQKNVFYVEIPAWDVSSTMIRERVKAGEGVKYLVPPDVEVYVNEHGFYS